MVGGLCFLVLLIILWIALLDNDKFIASVIEGCGNA